MIIEVCSLYKEDKAYTLSFKFNIRGLMCNVPGFRSGDGEGGVITPHGAGQGVGGVVLRGVRTPKLTHQNPKQENY